MTSRMGDETVIFEANALIAALKRCATQSQCKNPTGDMTVDAPLRKRTRKDGAPAVVLFCV
jgi:hypothetical protein